MTDADLTGETIDDRYRVLGRLGEGAMGSVYRAERLKLGRIVAIKVMNERLPDAMASRKRFEREAKAMARLEHPHCASVLDIGVHNSKPYVVMDFVDGSSLASLVDRGPVPVARALEIVKQVLSGLAHAHELGIIHRDIKPANIMLSQKAGLGDQVKILDFGLARLSEESSSLTAGIVVGTPSYMAPEQVRGILIDGRADLYACGVLLFELLTGQKPFRSANKDPVEVCMMHINVPAPRLAERSAAHDLAPLEPIVARALEKDRDARYQTAAEFAEALAAVQGRATPRPDDLAMAATSLLSADISQPVAPKPEPEIRSDARPDPKSKSWLPAIGGLLALIAVAAIAIVAVTREKSPASAAKPAGDAAAALAPDATPADDPVAAIVSAALVEAHDGSLRPAIDTLVKARRTYPRDARLPFHAGKLYLDRMYFADGLPLIRTAVALDPSYRSDPELIKAVLRGFNATASYDATIARFLREDIGDAAKPYLEETASSHPNPIVRKRASDELRRYP